MLDQDRAFALAQRMYETQEPPDEGNWEDLENAVAELEKTIGEDVDDSLFNAMQDAISFHCPVAQVVSVEKCDDAFVVSLVEGDVDPDTAQYMSIHVELSFTLKDGIWEGEIQ